MNMLESMFDRVRPMFEKGGKLEWAWPMYEGGETFMLTPGTRTHSGAHVRDPMDMKRLMIFVIYALIPTILLGMYNIGYQGYVGEGTADPSILDSLLRGLWHWLPIVIVSYTAGGIAELIFAVVRKHEINEGFLVSAMLYPLTLSPTTPLWVVAAGIIFGVVIGKEVFGGVGMNILNPALTARAFVFFAYPMYISGAALAEGGYVWSTAASWNPLTGEAAAAASTNVLTGAPQAYTGATMLQSVANADPGAAAVSVWQEQGWSFMDAFWGFIPGCMGEVSAAGAIFGAVFLVATGIASWRIIAGCVVGLLAAGTVVFYGLGSGEEAMALFTIPPYYHLVIGGFAFGAVFMATDPVSSASTATGRWIYGILIGVLCVTIRVFNPAYPEGMMLAILFMNVFAPLIDYFVVNRKKQRRAARLAAA